MATLIVTIADDGSIIDGSALGAGDRIEIEGNLTAYNNLRFRNVNGSLAAPIIIHNAPDRSGAIPDYTVQAEIATGSTSDIQFLDNCHHFIMSGDGIPTLDYGFKLGRRVRCVTDMSDAAFYRIDSDSSNVCFFFQEQQSTGDPNHVIRNLHIADNRLKAANNECMYIGPNSATAVADNWMLENLLVERNLCYDSAEGIQVGSNRTSLIVRYNTLLNIQPQTATAFNSAITLPRGGVAEDTQIYGNLVIECGGFGININDTFAGAGDVANMYNNVLVRCGQGPVVGEQYAYRVQAGSGVFNFFNNTIISTGSGGNGDAIRLTAGGGTYRTENNIIIDSEVDDITTGNGATTTDVNNIKQATDAGLNFANAGADDYRILSGSSAIAAAVSGLTNPQDFREFNRVGIPDVGAYEFIANTPSGNAFNCGVGSVTFGDAAPAEFRGEHAGWESTAEISNSKGGNWDLSFRATGHTTSDNVAVVMGVSAVDTDQRWDSIDFGVYLWHLEGVYSRVAVVENGVMEVISDDVLAGGLGGETYHIRKNGTSVELTTGIVPVVVHTFSAPAPASVVIDNSAFWSEIYDGSITIDNIMLDGA